MNNFKKSGRPEIEKKRTKEKRILFTEAEFQKLNKLFSESAYQTMNDMIRDILLKKKNTK
jgi:hypothetical protein